MTNSDIADLFKLFADLSELHGGNPFKIKQFTNAFFRIDKMLTPLENLSIPELEKIEGIGKGIAAKIDEINKTELITKGIFSISRNPIFLGMIVSVLGLFFVIPNALMFCLTITTYIVIQIQIRLEEQFLQKQHGQVYINYKQKTRRLI